MKLEERYEGVLGYWQREMPEADTELHYRNEYELLVAVMLSAQCTDKRVNIVTPALFEKYPTVREMAKAEIGDIYEKIKSVSYPNAKSQHLRAMAEIVVERFGGEIPRTREELESLPGVGRKTANVMLIVAFGQPAMPVDTHVQRVANRIGLVRNTKTPRQTEDQLVKHIPPELLNKAHHWLILHGRYVCKALKPMCQKCGIRAYCATDKKKKE